MSDVGQRILYEDNHLIVINKRCGEIVQGDKTGDETLPDLIKAYIRQRDEKPGNVFLGVVHRLDRPTSGAVIFAKTSKGLSRMNELFRKGSVDKIYWALVESPPKKSHQTLKNYLFRDRKKNRSFCWDSPGEGRQEARLTFKKLHSRKGFHLLEIELHTGRHHQIRCQLSALGCSIVGDLKYGAKKANSDGGINLHARKISFQHPVKKVKVTITAPVPSQDKLWQSFESEIGSADER